MSRDEASLARDLPTEPQQKALRVAMLVLTAVVGIYCIWVLSSELIRPGVISLPVDPQSAAIAAQKRARANWAAQVGIIRGDLWAESGYTFANLLWKSSSGEKEPAQSLESGAGAPRSGDSLRTNQSRCVASARRFRARFSRGHGSIADVVFHRPKRIVVDADTYIRCCPNADARCRHAAARSSRRSLSSEESAKVRNYPSLACCNASRQAFDRTRAW